MRPFTPLENVGITFSVLLVLYIVKKLWDLVYVFVIGPQVNKVDFKSKGKWALVTGSTDGIGKEYARQLAARGCDIILVSRSMDKLKTVAEEIENEFKVQTKVVQIDFAGDLSIYDKLADEIKDLEIGTLVNNVGVSYSYPEYFLELPDWSDLVSKLVAVNIVSVIRVTNIVLAEMVKREKGVVINVGSGASTIPAPLLTVYAAAKAFVSKFSESLEYEYSNKGIIIQCVAPGFVATNMSKIRRTSFFAPSAKDYVKSALNLVGSTSETYGYFSHSLMFFFFDAISAISENLGAWIVKRNLENSRRIALKKYKKN